MTWTASSTHLNADITAVHLAVSPTWETWGEGTPTERDARMDVLPIHRVWTGTILLLRVF